MIIPWLQRMRWLIESKTQRIGFTAKYDLRLLYVWSLARSVVLNPGAEGWNRWLVEISLRAEAVYVPA